ncbi:hypothetical protein LRAMOSA05585 [Lichtheimia ramosa]|uniref:Uncharacterized protein n=1 Tax=Lichtheimia ramosa TaxID=688394 RepID=A0A077X2Z8_9FUNG|nr:hypothetical protein LRAMOSA05585 [Lichtheimia ramosa]
MSNKWERPALISPAARQYVYPNGWNGKRKTLMQLIPQPKDLPVQKYTHDGKYLFKAFLVLVFINTLLSFFK